MVSERSYTARLLLENGEIWDSCEVMTLNGEPRGQIDHTVVTSSEITLSPWRLRGPVVKGAGAYDYIPARSQPVTLVEIAPGATMLYVLTHHSLPHPYTVRLPLDQKLGPWFDANRPAGPSVAFDDPDLVIEPDPRK